MAVTKIHSIKSTLNLAISYVTNPHKTEEQKYVSGYACSPEFAALEFAHTKQTSKSSGKILAQHLIQSFLPGEVTPERAHEIGKKLCDELLKGQYEYVISTHVDKGHIHNHIIINSVNFVTGKTFETELNRGGKAWLKIRSISDNLCAENGLSVVKNAERGNGKSHYEWERENAGASWKTRIRTDIDECVRQSSSYEVFLNLMLQKGYKIKQGKYIAFHADGQNDKNGKELYCRGKTLGWYYSEEQLKTRIERRVMRRAKDNPYLSDKRVKGFIRIDDKISQSQGLTNWALVQNMKNASRILNALAEKNITSEEQLKEKIIDLYDYRLDVQEEIKGVEAQMSALSVNLKNLKSYRDLKPINDRYNQAKNKDKFFRGHEDELQLYGLAKESVKNLIKDNGKLPAITVLEKQYEALTQQKSELMKKYKDTKKEITELEKLKDNLEKMQQNEIENAREK